MLERELEKQAVQAAAAYAAAQSSAGSPTGGLRSRVGDGGTFMLPTIIYAGSLGSIILAIVLYRVYRIVQSEAHEHKRRHDASHRRHPHDALANAALLSTQAASPTDESAASIDIDASDDERDTVTAAAADPSDPLSSSSSSQQTQCYKRSQPPLSPSNRLLHV